ncbi:23S rRNA (uracil(1939)-C(5))-methyltransferase RlmD [Baia soyae]|uniref:23S rRNA (uracil(1939)-C(5))-methyltransferase RlmD n=1 Tax=Baia soyae TaxID=1544746 RepID=UPI001FB4EA71|nr:23S rRNA (uracil(1939)-C(5))-methyltransferase RlmD [Baia soyae]
MIIRKQQQQQHTRKDNRQPKEARLEEGQVVTIPIRKLGINGEGVGHVQKKVVFVEGAIPGEEVQVRIGHVEDRFAYGELMKVVKRSPYRVEPECPVYDRCGGCTIQHIHKRFQARLKREQIEESFRRYTSLTEIPIEPTIRMQDPWKYRNKAQLPVKQLGRKVVMGLYTADSNHLVDASECKVHHPKLNDILERCRKVVERLRIPVVDGGKRSKGIRHLVARIGFRTDEVQLVIVSSIRQLEQEAQLVDEIRKRVPELVSIVYNWNPEDTSLVFGEETRVLWGEEKLQDRLGDYMFNLSARAFYQLNPQQTEVLYDQVKKVASLTGTETVIDAYCGVGTIGIWLAADAKKVMGIESIEEAVADARENAEINEVDNIEFHYGQAEELIPSWVDQGLRPDVIVVDPPRAGLGQVMVDTLCEVKVPRFIYVSCNPATLAKDSEQLLKAGYELENIIPVDLFPQTAHIEAVCRFVYKK